MASLVLLMISSRSDLISAPAGGRGIVCNYEWLLRGAMRFVLDSN